MYGIRLDKEIFDFFKITEHLIWINFVYTFIIKYTMRKNLHAIQKQIIIKK